MGGDPSSRTQQLLLAEEEEKEEEASRTRVPAVSLGCGGHTPGPSAG